MRRDGRQSSDRSHREPRQATRAGGDVTARDPIVLAGSDLAVAAAGFVGLTAISANDGSAGRRARASVRRRTEASPRRRGGSVLASYDHLSCAAAFGLPDRINMSLRWDATRPRWANFCKKTYTLKEEETAQASFGDPFFGPHPPRQSCTTPAQPGPPEPVPHPPTPLVSLSLAPPPAPARSTTAAAAALPLEVPRPPVPPPTRAPLPVQPTSAGGAPLRPTFALVAYNLRPPAPLAPRHRYDIKHRKTVVLPTYISDVVPRSLPSDVFRPARRCSYRRDVAVSRSFVPMNAEKIVTLHIHTPSLGQWGDALISWPPGHYNVSIAMDTLD
ncbi:hypothetical protein THAOC_31895 [Thalassiosira oceanica]|uniref:Uncharacterized protein n=1 Tax=Thalassiosira oceanica TaxID=159749 RepID=K0RRJ6_THAOC|nr:hypothetical protein THAOC_31895 [Thalassiosira oceanica]|eukprot:EJK49252.1 hypothetical protein THAOC_31895 [Thalassiosira oceanica]